MDDIVARVCTLSALFAASKDESMTKHGEEERGEY
jgi:hypothetical protein